jgi:pyruvate,orthophosphate dikinase
VGVECGEGAALALIEDLYATGLRTFSVPLQPLSGVRLALGHRALKDQSH